MRLRKSRRPYPCAIEVTLMSLIREYQAEDARQLEECIVELQDFERRIDARLADGRTIAGHYLQYILSRCDETDGKIFVAEVDGRMAGFVSVWAKVKTRQIEESEYEYAYISDLVVLPEHRGQSIGRALLRRAEDYAVQQGATLLRIAVLAKNEAARNLYARFGFEERLVELSKNL